MNVSMYRRYIKQVMDFVAALVGLVVLSPLLLLVWLTFANKETVARWRSTALLSTFGFGHVREYASVSLSLSALYFTTVQRLSRFACKSARMALRATFSKGARCFSLALK
ncbi:hypothetical protein IX339_000397 [Porphyromonas levii]|nr:hypothetical protein [Porphyromonas levii]